MRRTKYHFLNAGKGRRNIYRRGTVRERIDPRKGKRLNNQTRREEKTRKKKTPMAEGNARRHGRERLGKGIRMLNNPAFLVEGLC